MHDYKNDHVDKKFELGKPKGPLRVSLLVPKSAKTIAVEKKKQPAKRYPENWYRLNKSFKDYQKAHPDEF